MSTGDANSPDNLDSEIVKSEKCIQQPENLQAKQFPPNPPPADRNDESSVETAASRAVTSTSSPIDITQASCGKFGVLRARLPPSAASPSADAAAGLMIDSNGEPVPIDKVIRTANTMSSMMMAHKIALEDDFRLEPGMDISGPLMSLSPIIGSSPSPSAGAGVKQEPSLHNRVKDIVHEAYWDLFREEVNSQSQDNFEERKYDISKQLLCDIKQKVLELLLPQHSRLKQDVEDKLDIKIIDQLTRVHSLKLIEYGHYILTILSKLCAPVRDERLKELADCTDVVQLYRGIMEMLELMRLDFANFTLNQFKPHIRAHSHDYEREKFAEILSQQKTIGIDGLEYTKVWLSRAVERIDKVHGIVELLNEVEESQVNLTLDQEQEEEHKEDAQTHIAPEAQRRIERSDIVNKVLNAAYCELLEWTPRTQKLYPETLLFDEATFKQLSEQYKVLLITASILLATFAFVNRFKIQESNEFKILIKSHIITLLTATYDQSSTSKTNANNPCDPSKPTSPTMSPTAPQTAPKMVEEVDSLKLRTVATKLCDDIRTRILESGGLENGQLESFEGQKELLKRQILDLQSSSNRIRELARRRILEFVETLLDLDVKHQQKKFPSRMPPPVNIPLGLNCLTDEITLTMAQLVKIIRYNRRVFFQHYHNIITEHVSKLI